MALSNDLISQFAKITNDNKKVKTEKTVYGTAVVYDGAMYVKLDGSDLLTPYTTTAEVKDGDRVAVVIKNHTATVTGNLTSPAARIGSVEEVNGKVNIVIDGLEATNGFIRNLETDYLKVNEKLVAAEASIDELTAKDVKIEGTLTAQNGDIENLKTSKLDADTADIKFATIENLDATNADIHNLEADYGDFKALSTENFEATDAVIKSLDTEYAHIDFANIDKAAMEYLYAQSGLIKDVKIGDATIAGELVGVTIKGDLIEGNTIVADKLVIKGDDGVYYKLNYESGALSGDEVAKTVYHKVVNETFYYKVILSDVNYVIDIEIEPLEGTIVEGVYTTDGLQVYTAALDGEEIYFCTQDDNYCVKDEIEPLEGTIVEGVYTTDGLQVYTAALDGEEIYFCSKVVYPDWAMEKLHGSVIAAKSITADQITVSDLIAFGATIGGFEIGTNSIHSISKDTVENTNPGIYMDNAGQLNIGNNVSYIKYYKVVDANNNPVLEDGKEVYKLEISADSVTFGNKKLSSMFEKVDIGTYIDSDGDEKPAIRLYETDSDDKPETIITNESVSTDLVDTKEVRQGNFAWRRFANGYGLMWIENEVTG